MLRNRDELRETFAKLIWENAAEKGITLEEATELTYNRNYSRNNDG